MCNTVYCGLINININRDVQEECANRLYRVCTYCIAAMRMMENNGCFYSLLN